MFIVYRSNKIETLFLKAHKIIEKNPLSNIFEQEIFLHDNKILFQYLNVFIANQKGISANIKYYHPYNFILKLFQKFFGIKEYKNIFTQSIMTWKIMKILDEKKICEYINIKENKMKKFKFSFLMANIFEQYLFYRPDWINTWEKEKLITSIGNSDQWQIKLWKEIINNYQNMNPLKYHFSSLLYKFQLLIKQDKIKKKHFPKRCFIISSPQLNPVFIEIFKKISIYFNIYFLQVKFSKKNRFQNPLMRLCKNQELFKKINILDSKKIKIINYFEKNKNNNLLNHIKNDFLEDKFFKKKRIIELTDNSISINICYNRKNEIEILHEKLLLFLEKNQYIKLSDIVVTSFSMDDYISSIDTIFNAAHKKNKLPFFISTKKSKKTEIIFSVFKNLLNLSNSRFENEEILELFDIPEIADRFDISEEEINILYYWIKEVNIRWAINEKHKKKFSFSQNKQNTWFYGIEKLLLSYAMNDTENIWNDILSSTLIHGSRADLIGKLVIFINVLKKWQKKLSKLQNLIYWRSLSKNIINDFFLKSERINDCLQIIQKKWIEMIDDALLSNYKKKISIEILKKNFIIKNNPTNNKKFLPGVINFCHPSSICFIPFKIICFIGADNKNIPKQNTLDNFNLLNKYPITSDFNAYQKYYFLFLQNISCAQKYFYISYVGYSIKDNSKIYPSVMVDQLLSYIISNFYLMGDQNLTTNEKRRKITKHLCKTYTKEYFYTIKNTDDFKIENSISRLKNTEIKIYESKLLKKKCFDTIDLIDLICFWKNPIHYFFKNHLNIKFDLPKQELIITEPFSVHQLDAFEIKKILLNKAIKCEDTKKIFQYYRLCGKLPYNFFGTVFWKDKIKEMQSISKLVNKYRNCTEEKKINIHIQKYRINGILSEIQSTGLLRWKPTLINYSDRISLWIEHLIYTLICGTGESKIIGYKNQMWSYICLDPNTAYDYLLKYIEGYVKGSQKPLFLIKSGAAWLDQIYDIKNNVIKQDNNSIRKGYKKLLETWMGNNYFKGEKKDIYIRSLIKTLNEKNIKKICQTAQIWLTPLLKNKKILK